MKGPKPSHPCILEWVPFSSQPGKPALGSVLGCTGAAICEAHPSCRRGAQQEGGDGAGRGIMSVCNTQQRYLAASPFHKLVGVNAGFKVTAAVR